MGILRRENAGSNALRRLRFSVTTACVMIVAALIIHILVWAFASFTEVRYTRMSATGGERSATVVVQGREVPNTRTGGEVSSGQTSRVEGVRPRGGPEIKRIDANLVTTGVDTQLRILHQIATALAYIGFGLLLIEALLGVVVAGGLRAKGVGRIVSAQLWSVLVLALVVPWDHIISGFAISGVLPSYSAMIAFSESYQRHDPGAIPAALFYGRFLAMPAATIGIVVMIGGKFWIGSSSSIASDQPTATEIAVEQEASERQAGSVMYGGRASGALRFAIPEDEQNMGGISLKPKSKGKSIVKGKVKGSGEVKQQQAKETEINIGLMTGTGPFVHAFDEVDAEEMGPIEESRGYRDVDRLVDDNEGPKRRPI